MKYSCTLCDYVYDPELGDPDGDIAPGVEFKDLPEDWVCPLCGASKEDFEPIEADDTVEKISTKLFKCSVCGYIHEGEDAPETCPKCGAPKEKFEELDKESAGKIYSSDRTNDIHMELISLSDKMQQLAMEGIELNLDPPCVKVFENALNEAWVIKQRSKAEIAGHVGKGKW